MRGKGDGQQGDGVLPGKLSEGPSPARDDHDGPTPWASSIPNTLLEPAPPNNDSSAGDDDDDHPAATEEEGLEEDAFEEEEEGDDTQAPGNANLSKHDRKTTRGATKTSQRAAASSHELSASQAAFPSLPLSTARVEVASDPRVEGNDIVWSGWDLLPSTSTRVLVIVYTKGLAVWECPSTGAITTPTTSSSTSSTSHHKPGQSVELLNLNSSPFDSFEDVLQAKLVPRLRRATLANASPDDAAIFTDHGDLLAIL